MNAVAKALVSGNMSAVVTPSLRAEQLRFRGARSLVAGRAALTSVLVVPRTGLGWAPVRGDRRGSGVVFEGATAGVRHTGVWTARVGSDPSCRLNRSRNNFFV